MVHLWDSSGGGSSSGVFSSQCSLTICSALFVLFSQIFVPLTLASSTPGQDSQQVIENLISKGDKSRAAGQMTNALQAYNEAIRLDPKNYLLIFKRGAVYTSIPGKESSAIADFGTVLDITPTFIGALKQRVSLYLKLGKLDDAVKDAESIKQFEQTIHPQKSDEKLQNQNEEEGSEDKSFSETILGDVEQVRKFILESQSMLEKKDYDQCIDLASNGLRISSSSTALLNTRMKCSLQKAQPRSVIRDLNTLELYVSDDELYVKDAKIQYYVFHDSDTAISKLQRCLRFNMDSKPCQTAFREIRSFEKKIGRYAGISDPLNGKEYAKDDNIWKEARHAILPTMETKIRQSVKQAYEEIGLPKDKKILDVNAHSDILLGLEETLCVAFYNMRELLDTHALKYCDLVISHEIRPESEEIDKLEHLTRSRKNAQITAHLFRIDKAISQEKYSIAQEEVRQALGYHPQEPRIVQKQHEANGPKRSTPPVVSSKGPNDYYKTLGVPRTATDKEIRSAYREKTKQFHPDKYRGELSSEEVDKKMAEVNQAYEVLSTPELRARFDRGDDPNSSGEQGGGGGPGGHGPGGVRFQNPHFNGQNQRVFHQFFQNGGGQFFQQQFGGGSGGGNNGFNFGSFHKERPGGGGNQQQQQQQQKGKTKKYRFNVNHGSGRRRRNQ